MREVDLKSSDEEVVIALSGKITAVNSKEVETDMFSLLDANPGKPIVLDVDNLVYISSAGLRVLVKLKQNYKTHIRIINTSVDVMEVFEETGMTGMFEVTRAVKHYRLEGLEKIAQGANGEVYRLDHENIVKVFAEHAPIEDVKREQNLARQALISGIPTAISYTVSVMKKEGEADRCGIVFEALDANTLSIVLKENPDTYDEYVEEYVELYKRIHNTENTDDVFPSIKSIYYGLIDECKSYYTEEEVNKLRALVDSVPDRKTLIHGDYHPNNIMVMDGELMLIDMGDMSMGHPIFDFLATAATQVNLVKLSPEFAEGHTRMPVELISKTWRFLIDTYFSDKDEAERKRIEEQICIFSKLKVALAPAVGRGAAEEIIMASINDAKENFLPLIDDLIGSVDW
ncbi:MAG: anti-sigma factor antagonist [Eubacterium sp.]|nr:anti-sigma factor antagonist [Eubacterium sp.]